MNARGQALLEAVVASLLLVPLFFAVVQLAQMQTAEQATLEATRAAALAAHLGLDDGQGRLPPQRIRELYLSDAAGDAEVAVSRASQPSSAQQAESVVLTLIAPARLVGVGELDLARSQALEARAAAAVPALFGPVDPSAAGGRLAARLPLMTGDWEAEGVNAVWRRTAALSTMGRIAAWRSVLTPVTAPLRLLEPAAARLCLGRIDPDIVPTDRLKGIAAVPDLRTQPC